MCYKMIRYFDCSNLPFSRRARQNRYTKAFVSKGENERSRHKHLFKGKCQKTKKRSLNFENKGSGFFTHGEGISIPRTHHKGRQPLFECVHHDFRIIYFSLFYFFLFFRDRQGYFLMEACLWGFYGGWIFELQLDPLMVIFHHGRRSFTTKMSLR